MKTELTERYVGATLRSIPEKQRADIEAELRASIDDAVEAKVADGQDVASAEKEVLTGLGDPDRLAADYVGRPGYLIGPEIFFSYKRLVGVLLLTVVPVVAAVIAVIQIMSEADFGSVVGQVIGTAISVGVHIVFWTTLTFVVIERSGEKAKAGTEWSLAHLPPVTAKGGVSLGETIGVVVGLVFGITALILSRTLSPIRTDAGEAIPIFDPSMWDFWFPYLIVVLAIEIIFELFKYRTGGWTWNLATMNLVLNLAFAVPVIYLLLTEQLLNPVFFEELGFNIDISTGGPVVTASVLIIAGVALWDTIDGYRRARKAA